MKGSCSKEGCPAPVGKCLVNLNEEFQICEHFKPDTQPKSNRKKEGPSGITNFPWHGKHLKPEELNLVSFRTSPIVIGILGTPGAAKTSYLGMIYMLLTNGKKLQEYEFTGSYTLKAWEDLARDLQFKMGKVRYPQTTPSIPDFYSIYHLALKKKGKLQDILFVDLSGEVFKDWAHDRNDENAENVRWLHKHSTGFILFMDSEAMKLRKGAALPNMLAIAGQLAQGLENRPVAVVWSKADTIDQVLPIIRARATDELIRLFGNSLPQLEISNHSNSDPDLRCHVNNLNVLDQLLSHINQPQDINLEIPSIENDPFFHYH